MTRTYNDLRGYRGYSAIATHTRAHAREICSGLKITPHNPANPANQGKASPATPIDQRSQGAAKTSDTPTGTVLRHCRCKDCLNFSRIAGTYYCSAGIGGTSVVWGTGERVCEPAPDAWHYCARYRGPQISKDIWVWPHPTHHVGAGSNTSGEVDG